MAWQMLQEETRGGRGANWRAGQGCYCRGGILMIAWEQVRDMCKKAADGDRTPGRGNTKCQCLSQQHAWAEGKTTVTRGAHQRDLSEQIMEGAWVIHPTLTLGMFWPVVLNKWLGISRKQMIAPDLPAEMPVRGTRVWLCTEVGFIRIKKKASV